MNLHPPGERDKELRMKWLKQGNISNEDLQLNFEQFKAKQLLKWVKAQVTNKTKFHNKIIITNSTVKPY